MPTNVQLRAASEIVSGLLSYLKNQNPQSLTIHPSNSGQSCNAPTRMLVERCAYDRAVQIAKEVAEATKVAPAQLRGRHIGPVVSKQQWDKIQVDAKNCALDSMFALFYEYSPSFLNRLASIFMSRNAALHSNGHR
jgi:hypothetical protein